MQPNFSEYARSLRTLDRRLRYLKICKTEENVSIEEVLNRLFSIRWYHQLNVPRALVHAVMEDDDPNGSFTSQGAYWVLFFDGHDKLMGFQNSTFPIAIYGYLNAASRKLVWIKV